MRHSTSWSARIRKHRLSVTVSGTLPPSHDLGSSEPGPGVRRVSFSCNSPAVSCTVGLGGGIFREKTTEVKCRFHHADQGFMEG